MLGCSKNDILITNIQRFSLHDGPGIRTTVFLKGCSLRCPWCSNPENVSPNIQRYKKDGKEGVYGVFYTMDELYDEILKDKLFFKEKSFEFGMTLSDQINCLPGGVTFSGGECLLQIKQLEELLDRLNMEKIHIAVETSLFVPNSNLHVAIKHIDLFYVDVKILEKERCKKELHGNLDLYLSNMKILFGSGKPVVIRVPVIAGYTDGSENINNIISLIEKYVRDQKVNLLKVEIIKEHCLGISKYQSLSVCNEGYEVPDYKGVSDDFMEHYRKKIIMKTDGLIPVEICKI